MDKELTTKDKVDLAIQTYNKYSSVYSKYVHEKLLQFQLAQFVSLLPSKGKVLDVGSGSGRDSLYLKEDGLEVVSIDISDGMIEESKKNGIKPLKIDIRDTKKLPNDFDGIWCMATFADIPKEDSVKVIKNFNSLLKPEGIIYIAVKEGEGEVVIEKERYGNSPRFYSLYKKDELVNLLKQNGFEIIEAIVSNDEENNWVEVFAKKI